MTATWAKLRWLLTYWISRFGVAAGRFIPARVAYAIATPIADVCYLILSRHRRGLTANLQRVLPSHEAGPAARRAFRNFARYVIDFYQLPSLGKEALCRRIEFHQWRQLYEAVDAGNGTIFVTLHLGQAELGAGALSAYNHPISVIAEKLAYAPMDAFVQGLRRQLGMKIIPAKSAKPGVLRCLNRGEVLGLMFDAVEPGDGLAVRFFDGDAEFSGTPARIATRTGARVLPAVVARDPGDPARLLPVIDFDFAFEPAGDDEADVLALTQAIASSFEAMVARFPDQWFAFRPLWRETPARMERKKGTRRWMQWSLAIAARLGGRMPRALAYGCARLAGDLAFRLRPAASADVADNMRHVLGPHAPAGVVSKAAREVFRNVARYYVDLVRLPLTNPKQLLDQQVTIRGLDFIKERVARGQGVVIATAHFGNPEVGVQVGAMVGLDLLVLAEPLSPPSFAELMTKIRGAFGVRYDDVGYSGVSKAIRHLRGGGVLAITCDRDIQGAGSPLSFFGQTTRMPLGAVELAARTGAALVPGHCRRVGSRFEIVFEPSIELVSTGSTREDALANAAALLRKAETWIGSDPGQWMVLERIWKPLPQERAGHSYGAQPVAEPRKGSLEAQEPAEARVP